MDEQVYISRYGTSQLDEGWELLSQEARHRDFLSTISEGS